MVMAALVLFAVDLAVMALFTDSKTVLVVCVVVAGVFLGVNNTLITEAVMIAAPVERSVASAAYSFVRFVGGAIAPFAAGKLGENVNVHVPFWMGAVAVLVGAGVLFAWRDTLHGHGPVDDADEDAEQRPSRRPSCSRSATSTDRSRPSGRRVIPLGVARRPSVRSRCAVAPWCRRPRTAPGPGRRGGWPSRSHGRPRTGR